jgi:hypothetical protein
MLDLNNPGEFSALQFLAASAEGPANTTVTLNFADGSHAASSVSVADWFSSNPAAITPNGRVYLGDGGVQNENSGNPRLYEYDVSVPVADQSKDLVSVTFDPTSGAELGVFALSGIGQLDYGQHYANTINVLGTSTISVGGCPEAVVSELNLGTSALTVSGASGDELFASYGHSSGLAMINVTAGMTVNFATTSLPAGITKTGGGLLFLNVNKFDGDVLGGNVTVTGGTLEVAGQMNGSLSISNAANVKFDLNSGAQQLSLLAISGNGLLDLTNNHVIISYGAGSDPIASIAAWIASGFNGGAWNGAGINSSAAAGNSLSYGIGYADSADPNNPAGLASGTIEIKYTLLGDANLDGKVNGADFAILASNFNKSVAGVSGWDQGDFNYDGKINGADFALLAENFNKGASGAANAGDLAAIETFAEANGLTADVPEPISGAIIASGVVGMMARRKRRRESGCRWSSASEV